MKTITRDNLQKIANAFGLYFAKDESGDWYHYSNRPTYRQLGEWRARRNSGGIYIENVKVLWDVDWKESLISPQN